MARFIATLDTLCNRLSLGTQLAAITGVLCLVLVLACAVTTANIASGQATQRVEQSMTTLARFMSQKLDSFMEERVRDIGDLANLSGLEGIWTSPPLRIRAALEEIQRSLPAYTWIGYADPAGNVVASTGGLLEGASVAERPWFKNGSLAPTVEDVHDAKLLAGLLTPQVSGEPFRFVDVAFPITAPNGRALGVVGAHMSWEWSRELRDVLLSAVDASSSTSIWILRSDGRALLGPEYDTEPLAPEQIAALEPGKVITFVDEGGGEPHLTAALRSAEAPGWIVASRRPIAIALAPSQQLSGTILVVGLALAALGVVTALILARVTTRPLRKLAEQVDLIGRDPRATMRRERGSRDVQMLSTAVRSLLRRIGVAHDAQAEAEHTADVLKQRMDERTRTYGEHLNALQQLADTDPLTRLLNRRAFLVFADDALAHYHRYNRMFGILVIDIDHFKRVNDTFGHGVGDDVIEEVGRLVQGEVRTTDKVARFGGEEFVVLLRETEEEGAIALAERIRIRIAADVIDARGHGAIHVTVSVGLALVTDADRDVGDLIERADRALYRAKTGGRNAVQVDDGTGIAPAVAAE